MRPSLLVKLYRRLPPEGPVVGDERDTDSLGLYRMLARFRSRVARRYSEGTLHRLLASDDDEARRAAALALGLAGTMAGSNAVMAARLHDPDPVVRRLAENALWELWFRGGGESLSRELERLLNQRDLNAALAGLDRLVRNAPDFAEAINQRAIVHYRRGDYRAALRDCQRVLKLNPHHFGAQAGLAQCHLRLRQPRAALNAFRQALRIHPDLAEVADAVRALERSLGEGGR